MKVEDWYLQMRHKASIPKAVQATLDDMGAMAEAELNRLLDTKTALTEEFWADHRQPASE